MDGLTLKLISILKWGKDPPSTPGTAARIATKIASFAHSLKRHLAKPRRRLKSKTGSH